MWSNWLTSSFLAFKFVEKTQRILASPNNNSEYNNSFLSWDKTHFSDIENESPPIHCLIFIHVSKCHWYIKYWRLKKNSRISLFQWYEKKNWNEIKYAVIAACKATTCLMRKSNNKPFSNSSLLRWCLYLYKWIIYELKSILFVSAANNVNNAVGIFHIFKTTQTIGLDGSEMK